MDDSVICSPRCAAIPLIENGEMGLGLGATVSRQDAPKKLPPRTGGSRSRGGCNTCKVRRVKCDETKPGCHRCLKFGRVCDGYSVKKISPPAEACPKAGIRVRSLAPSTALGPRAACCPPRLLITLSFVDGDEERYFHMFHEETAGALSGGFDSPLWNRIVLQACHDEPCILHCAVAISALDRACKVKNIKDLAHTSESHHRYALQQYSKALQALREVVFYRQNPLRTACIASILIFCFENFHGDLRLALTNVRTTVDLMHSWLTQNSNSKSAKGFSPHPHIIEDDLVAAFARLDVHLMSWIDTPGIPRTSILVHAVTEPSPIPSIFRSVIEAKTHFDHIANRIFKYLAGIRHVNDEANASVQNQIYEANRTLVEESPVSVELRCWMSAFDPLLKDASEVDFVGANTLRIHALTLSVSLRSALFSSTPNNPQFDIFLPEYCEIVALARHISAHPTFVKSFVFDAGIVPSLFIIAAKSRDISLKREVIDVLKKAGPRREGVWDAFMVAKIGEELLGFESESNQVKERKWVEIYLQCVCTTFFLPATDEDADEDNVKEERDTVRLEGRKYLLGWVERTMQMDVVSEEPRYGRRTTQS